MSQPEPGPFKHSSPEIAAHCPYCRGARARVQPAVTEPEFMAKVDGREIKVVVPSRPKSRIIPGVAAYLASEMTKKLMRER